MNKTDNSSWVVEVFFDGDCPLCIREIGLLRRLDRHERIRFTDIADPSFDAAEHGLDHAMLMARIHARLPDGSFVEGVEVFRRLYSAVGFGPLVQLTRVPAVAWMLDRAYAGFAKNRLKWTGRCDESCAVRPPHPSVGAAPAPRSETLS